MSELLAPGDRVLLDTYGEADPATVLGWSSPPPESRHPDEPHYHVQFATGCRRYVRGSRLTRISEEDYQRWTAGIEEDEEG